MRNGRIYATALAKRVVYLSRFSFGVEYIHGFFSMSLRLPCGCLAGPSTVTVTVTVTDACGCCHGVPCRSPCLTT
jgi:hypothetical protein